VTTRLAPRKPPSLENYGGGIALPVVVTRPCTALTMAVYTRCTGAHAHSATARPGSGGHRPRGGSATGQGGGAPPEHLLLGLHSRSPPQEWQCTGQGGALGAAPQTRLHLLFFTFFTTFANVLTF
jgi:hypothetical protein